MTGRNDVAQKRKRQRRERMRMHIRELNERASMAYETRASSDSYRIKGIENKPQSDTKKEQRVHRFAYHLEGHDIVVAQLQQSGGFLRISYPVRTVELEEEAGLEWYIINGHLKLYAGDCTEFIKELKSDDLLEALNGYVARPDICFGRYEVPTALVTSNGRTIYQSPGYNLNSTNSK